MSQKRTTYRGKIVRISKMTFTEVDLLKREGKYKSYENVINAGIKALREKKQKKRKPLRLSDFGFR